MALQAQVTLYQELSCSGINNRPVRLRPKTTPCAEPRDTGVQREPSGRAWNTLLSSHSGLYRQLHNKLFCNSLCSDLINPLVQDILLLDLEKDPVKFGLFFSFLQIDLYRIMQRCSATCVKQRHARRKQHFTMIICSFFNLILDFFFLKMCFSLHGAVHFQSVSPTALQNSVLTPAGKISARLLDTKGKIKR